MKMKLTQSEASTGEQYVITGMHVGFINVDGEKCRKSLGNFFTIRDVMEKFHPASDPLFHRVFTLS